MPNQDEKQQSDSVASEQILQVSNHKPTITVQNIEFKGETSSRRDFHSVIAEKRRAESAMSRATQNVMNGSR